LVETSPVFLAATLTYLRSGVELVRASHQRAEIPCHLPPNDEAVPMTHALMLLSSPRGEASLSTKVAKALGERLKSELNATITVRDLASEPLPHVDPAYTSGRFVAAEQRTPAQAKAAGIAQTLVDELKAADIVVIGASMINFGPPSTLKAWIDYVVWPGITMIPTHDGPTGLITGKKVYVAVASGGVYSSGPMAPNDMLVPYLAQILGFIGITDVEVVRAEAQSFGPEAAKKGADAAFSKVAALNLADRLPAMA
jgi:FMN-dependent NADH-azoreductase